MRIYLDTNVFITAVEHSGKLAALIQGIIKVGETRPGLLATSELTLAELLVKPLRLSLTDNSPILRPGTLAAVYSDLIEQRPGLDVVPVDRSILILAAYHRAHHGADETTIRLPDAIHLATAEQSNCTHVMTGDQKLKPSRLYNFQRIDLDTESVNRLLSELA